MMMQRCAYTINGVVRSQVGLPRTTSSVRTAAVVASWTSQSTGHNPWWKSWIMPLGAACVGMYAASNTFCENATTARKASAYHPNAVNCESRAIQGLFTKIRDVNCNTFDFVHYSDRLMNILVEEGFARLPSVQKKCVTTPCGTYEGRSLPDGEKIVAVSIMRAGDSLLDAVRRAVPNVLVGKILIQRDESDEQKRPVLLYSKVPQLKNKEVMLVDPMLATGGSACKAIQELIKQGASEENILFLNVVSCPEGLQRIAKEYPKVRIVTAAVDSHLNDQKYIVPGVGDYGDRYYGTD